MRLGDNVQVPGHNEFACLKVDLSYERRSQICPFDQQLFHLELGSNVTISAKHRTARLIAIVVVELLFHL